MTWVLLLLAAVLEAVWAIALKKSHGFTDVRATIVFLTALAASMALLALALRTLPVGTAYAVWTGAGAVCAAAAGMVLLGEPVTPARIAAIALVAVGIGWLASAG
jgi:quaternary ammonium compound-resistance protein SugE